MIKTLLALAISILSISVHADDVEYINASSVNFRSDPNAWNSRVYYTLKRDSKLIVKKHKGNWLYVVDSRGHTGWVYSPLATKKVPASVSRSSTLNTASITPKAATPPAASVPPVAKVAPPVAPTSAAPAPTPPAPPPTTVTPAAPTSNNQTNLLPSNTSTNTAAAPSKNSGSVTAAAKNSGIPGAACIGPANAPVKVIYLHGWFAASGKNDVSDFRQLEFNNRAALEKMAANANPPYRIAVPLAPKVNSGNGMAEWNHSSIQKVEEAAEKACGVSKLPDKRTLLGFSSGGFAVNSLVCRAADQDDKDYIMDHYTERVALGTEGMKKNHVPTCGDITNISAHVFPPQSPDTGQQSIAYLQSLIGQSSASVAQAQDTSTHQ